MDVLQRELRDELEVGERRRVRPAAVPGARSISSMIWPAFFRGVNGFFLTAVSPLCRGSGSAAR